MMKALLLSLALVMPAFAGAPVDSYKEMKVYPVLCTPTLSSLMSALTTDYAVHVASTFTENPEAFIMIVENPDTETAAIIRITEQSSCLIFSGVDLQHFSRPGGMAPPEASIQRNTET
jgi:predicted RND superfamily exporter protein